MIDVTDAAVEAVAEYFKTLSPKPIRIFIAQGCGGQQLAMALDEISPSDAAHQAGGFEFIMDRALLDQARPVRVDYADMGFIISSSLELGGGCQSCGSSGSCCGS